MQERFTRALWFSLGIVGGSVLIFAAVIAVLSNQLQSTATKISTDRTLFSQRLIAIQTLARLRKDATKIGPYEKAMQALLPTADQLLAFPDWLQGLTRVQGLSMNFSFQGNQVAATGDAPGYIGFTIDVNGGIDSLINFFKDLESKSPRYLIRLDTLDITQLESSYRGFSQGKVFFH